ncbi:hypothetical protein LZ3411_1460 [Levilactobacillus zymae]|uniref:Uncharacterized protein n=1 Tax=Levilactobacillus zymae TaxID=267363 RepID=A0A1Y6JXI5_9LACO|nr:hypothetical protein LZ3411_1460 [Levilactobacillus zymae]
MVNEIGALIVVLVPAPLSRPRVGTVENHQRPFQRLWLNEAEDQH